MWNLCDKKPFFCSPVVLSVQSLVFGYTLTKDNVVAMMVHIFNLLHQQNNIGDDFFFFLGSFFEFSFGRFSSSLPLCRLSNFEFSVIHIFQLSTQLFQLSLR